MGDPFGMVSAGISAATNMAIAQATNASNARNVKDTNATNQAIAAENNATQISMQRENNEFNHNEAELANQRMIEQWQRETQYNSPIEQVARLEQAGLNPQLAYGGNSVNNVGAASHDASQASSASSGISPSMPNLIPFQAQMHLPGKDFADIAKALADAKKTGAEGDEIVNSLQDRLRKMKADADMADMAVTFERIYGGAMRDKSLQKSCQEVQLLTEQVFNLKKQGKLTEAETKLTEIKQLTESMDARMKKYQGDSAKLQSETYIEALNAQLNLQKAQANAANSSAALSTEEAKTISALRVDEVRLKKFEADYTSYNAGIALHTLENQPLVKAKLVRELLSLTEDITSKRLSNEQESILTARYGELIDQDIQKGEKQLRQMGQDYWNPFRYVGTLLGGGVASGMGKELIKPK